MISQETSFDLIHVGKCAGTSIAKRLASAGYTYEHFHMRKAIRSKSRRYLIIVREPISRFISAYNWRYYLLTNNLIPRNDKSYLYQKIRLSAEWELLSSFKDVNEFAENLTQNDIFDVSHLSVMLNIIGHVAQGFSWYLDPIINHLEHGQLLGIISYENLENDFYDLFGFGLEYEENRNTAVTNSSLSTQARKNLEKEFFNEYETLSKLKSIAKSENILCNFNY